MERNITIDILRGFCMFCIVGIIHLSQYLGQEHYLFLIPFGNCITWSCLGTFSLISGYLIGRKYCFHSFSDVGLFYKKRLVRFYPLFVLSAICLLCIGFNNSCQTVNALTGLSPFVHDKTCRPLTLWYISMIMIFYLISPLLLFCRKWPRIAISVLLMALSVGMSLFIYVDKRFVFNLFLYLLGTCLALFDLSELQKMTGWAGMIVSLIVYVGMLSLLDVVHHSILRWSTIFFGVLCFVIVASFLSKKISATNKCVHFLSYVSMSAYLFHRFTYWACLKIFHPDDLTLLGLYLFLFALPVTLCFAYYVQKCYDKLVSSFLSNKSK